MALAPDQASLERLKQELEEFIHSTRQPALWEAGHPVLELAGHEWQLTIQFGKLLFEVWNPGHSFVWRIDEISYRDDGRLGLFVRQPGAHQASTLELRESNACAPPSVTQARSTFRQELVAFLQSKFPGWRLERVSNRSDREHSFSAWYTRGMARRGRIGWAFIGLGDSELPAAADAALAYGLNWLDWLRQVEKSCVVSTLKLFLAPAAVTLSAHRAAYLDSRTVQIEIFEWPSCLPERWSPIDLADFGNVETRLTSRRDSQKWIERHRDFLQSAFGAALERMDLAPDGNGRGLSIRILGLEIARLEGDIAPRLAWGIEGECRQYHAGEEHDLQEFIRNVLSTRSARSENPNHPFCRLQPERWLESLLIRDITLVDPALNSDCVYPQVPAFSGSDRGVVDILSVLRDGRLAVIELKLHEEITLPMQGLDYWLRVKWLNDRSQFQKFGYFYGLDLAPAPPVLYLVSPAFRFHSTSQRIIRYLSPSVEVVQVGINQTWKEGVKVLFRRLVRP
jgi:hypothetical protein